MMSSNNLSIIESIDDCNDSIDKKILIHTDSITKTLHNLQAYNV